MERDVLFDGTVAQRSKSAAAAAARGVGSGPAIKGKMSKEILARRLGLGSVFDLQQVKENMLRAGIEPEQVFTALRSRAKRSIA